TSVDRDADRANLFYCRFEDGAWRVDLYSNSNQSVLVTHLFEAVANTDATLVTEFLTDDPDLINATSELGDTPITAASLTNNVDVGRILIAHHANVNDK